MNSYRECHRVSDEDNKWLLYYDESYCNDTNTNAEDSKHYRLGSMYTRTRDWYYQWNRDEEHYYVVVD